MDEIDGHDVPKRLFKVHSTGMQTKRENHIEDTTRSLNLVFLLEQPKNYQDTDKPRAKASAVALARWKDMRENAWNSIANRRTSIQSNHTRIPVLGWTITKVPWKSWRTKLNCQKFAPILKTKA